MQLNPTLFWDVDYNKIHWDNNYQWVICRVLDRGTLEDWQQIKAYYGLEKIISATKATNYISKKSVYFLSAIYNIPLTDFKCYNLMQSQPEHWIYCA
ncbi:MAG: hypothetical protein Q7W45_10855 [Bacteroidota bacterium]|nr:hypothetical protein [Bacteroidota bacterium]MDP3147178.1 hypothetical protein [Bacteroidota bacterium]